MSDHSCAPGKLVVRPFLLSELRSGDMKLERLQTTRIKVINETDQAVVIDSGVEDIEPGLAVLYPPNRGVKMHRDGVDLLVLEIKDVVAVSEEPPDIKQEA